MAPTFTRRDFLQALEVLVAHGFLSRNDALFAAFQATEHGGPGNVNQIDYQGNPFSVLLDYVMQHTQQINESSNAIGNAVLNFSQGAVDRAMSGSYIVGVGVQESAGAVGAAIMTSQGIVAAYDPSTAKVQMGSFVTVSPETSTSWQTQAGIGPVAVLGRGDLTNGFYGQSSSAGLSANLGEFGASASVATNPQSATVSISANVGIPAGPAIPAVSYTEESNTYGQSTVISVDGGAMMEGVYNTLWNMSQDPFTGEFK